jgi:hypothetical protein
VRSACRSLGFHTHPRRFLGFNCGFAVQFLRSNAVGKLVFLKFKIPIQKKFEFFYQVGPWLEAGNNKKGKGWGLGGAR